MLLVWDCNDSVLLRMTHRLLTQGVRETEELSIVREKLLENVDLLQMRRISVLSLFIFWKPHEEEGREEGVEFGLLER